MLWAVAAYVWRNRDRPAGGGAVLAFLPMIGLCAAVGRRLGAEVRREIVGALAVWVAVTGAAALLRR